MLEIGAGKLAVNYTAGTTSERPLRVIRDRVGQAAGPATSAMPRKRPTTVSGPHVAMGHDRTPAARQMARSFDDLVGGREQRWRRSEAERLRGDQVDDQLKFGRLLDRKVARLPALEDPAGVDSGLTIRIRTAGAVA
jgi:hypothetical protein